MKNLKQMRFDTCDAFATCVHVSRPIQKQHTSTWWIRTAEMRGVTGFCDPFLPVFSVRSSRMMMHVCANGTIKDRFFVDCMNWDVEVWKRHSSHFLDCVSCFFSRERRDLYCQYVSVCDVWHWGTPPPPWAYMPGSGLEHIMHFDQLKGFDGLENSISIICVLAAEEAISHLGSWE